MDVNRLGSKQRNRLLKEYTRPEQDRLAEENPGHMKVLNAEQEGSTTLNTDYVDLIFQHDIEVGRQTLKSQSPNTKANERKTVSHYCLYIHIDRIQEHMISHNLSLSLSLLLARWSNPI